MNENFESKDISVFQNVHYFSEERNLNDILKLY